MTNLALIIAFVVLAIIAYYKGRGMLFGIITAFYPAMIIYKAFPYTERLVFVKDTALQIYLSHLVIFLIFFLPIFFAVRRISHAGGTRQGTKGIVDSLLLSASVVSLSVVLTFRVLPERDIYHLTSNLLTFFNSEVGYFVVLALPLCVIYYLSDRSY